VATALVLCLWRATPVAAQAGPPTSLPANLRSHVQNGRLDEVTSIRGLPLGVRDQLQTLFGGGTLDIAEPRAPFQTPGRTVATNLPLRRLVAGGCTYTDCLVYYERGGSAPGFRIALFHWTPEVTRFEWGGTAPGGLSTIATVRAAVLSGEITSTAAPW
jgi:hypothetical protein